MFKYFIGKVYLLDAPPVQEDTTLEIDFPDEVVQTLDSENPGVEINPEQAAKISEYEAFMANAMGKEQFNGIRKNSVFRSCDIKIIKAIVSKLKENPQWPRNFGALSKNKSYEWREPILDVISILPDGNQKYAKFAVWKSVNNWNQSMASIHAEYLERGYQISIEELFAAERYLSYNLCSILAVVALLRKTINPDTPDISYFLGKASNAFLPKLVFQLEEYGLPRSLSRKIQDSGLINLEDDDIEISKIIERFKEIGQERLVDGMKDVMEFDKFIIDYFYAGIS